MKQINKMTFNVTIKMIKLEEFVKKLNNDSNTSTSIYNPILSDLNDFISKLIINSDLNDVIKFAKENGDDLRNRINELLPMIVNSVDLNDYVSVRDILNFLYTLNPPMTIKITLVSSLLNKSKSESHYKYISLVYAYRTYIT